MIFHSGVDGAGTVDLFREHKAGQLVGHGDASHAELECSGLFHLIGQAVGRADDKGHIPCPAAGALCQKLRQFIGGDLLALDADFFQRFHAVGDKAGAGDIHPADAVAAHGLDVELILFEGERHGFRKAGTIQRAFTAELAFYGKVLGFIPADDAAAG